MQYFAQPKVNQSTLIDNEWEKLKASRLHTESILPILNQQPKKYENCPFHFMIFWNGILPLKRRSNTLLIKMLKGKVSDY
jgi:hypothetical protein